MKRIIGLFAMAAALMLLAPGASAGARGFFAVPEPGTLLLIGIGIVALVIFLGKSSR